MVRSRLLEVAVGVALVGYCVYAVSTGEVLGKFRVYSRSEQPWAVWATVLITPAAALPALICDALFSLDHRNVPDYTSSAETELEMS